MNGREHGVRMGIGGVQTNEMRERQQHAQLNRVIGETYAFHKDPYMMINDLGIVECKLCSTTHRTRENYLLHTEGKKHKENLSIRQYHTNKAKERELKKGGAQTQQQQLNTTRHTVQKPRVGQPKCFVIQQYHPTEGFHAIAVKLEYPLIDKGMKPRYRVVNPYEQNVENPDEDVQYLVFAAEPYENVAIKIPNRPLDMGKILRDWDPVKCEFVFQIKFRDDFDSKWRHQHPDTNTSNIPISDPVDPKPQLAESINTKPDH